MKRTSTRVNSKLKKQYCSFLLGDLFEVHLRVLPSVPLPTKPKIRVYGVQGSGPEKTAMRRIDHAPFTSIQTDDYTIPFYIKNDNSEFAKEAKRSWSDPKRLLKLK